MKGKNISWGSREQVVEEDILGQVEGAKRSLEKNRTIKGFMICNSHQVALC